MPSGADDDAWRSDPREGNPWLSIFGKQKPTEEQPGFCREVWRLRGYGATENREGRGITSRAPAANRIIQ